MSKVIIFDFDGVIYNTFDFHLRKVEEYTGVKLDPEMLRSFHNGNFFGELPEELKKVDWKAYHESILGEVKVFEINPRVKETLLKLKENYPLYIVSSGSEESINLFLKENDVEVFEKVLGLESGHSKVDKFNMVFDIYKMKSDEFLFVTDTLGDILEAHEVNLPVLGILGGYHPRETLEKGEPLEIIEHFSDIEKYV